eukprot:CAMPEP_0197528570 /NCGR_PEP_ID=MMETSP1318-20131121/25560_1 /TAXON_ID=552666 /ORGANISM="Partenskyella glossopodia, Strain RCC365" /LENGTH=176 /DNA_ID=CAMNT_0043083719 /DNA_START=1 /DNA_END=531 /DNA_ORIENTATION=-
MDAAFADSDTNKSGYLEWEEIVPMMKVFFFVSRLDMMDYMMESVPVDQINATTQALAHEWFGNVTEETYKEEARAFIQKIDKDGDGKISKKELEDAFANLTNEFNKTPVTAEQFISYLSYYTGSLYRIGLLDGDCLAETQLLQILDKSKDPKEAIAAVMAYIKALRKKAKKAAKRS